MGNKRITKVNRKGTKYEQNMNKFSKNWLGCKQIVKLAAGALTFRSLRSIITSTGENLNSYKLFSLSFLLNTYRKAGSHMAVRFSAFAGRFRKAAADRRHIRARRRSAAGGVGADEFGNEYDKNLLKNDKK